jgi:hypothetical protein
MNCPDINYPLTTPCGFGVCINKTQCLCPPSWSGKGDFVYGEPHCNNNKDVLTAMWGFALFYGGVITLPCFFVTIAQAQNNILENKKFYDSNIFKMCLCAFAEVLFANLVGLLKLIYPERQIGTDPVITIAFAFSTGCLFHTVMQFLFCFIQLYSGTLIQFHTIGVKNLISWLQKIGKKYFIITQFSAFFPVFMLLVRSANELFYMTLFYYLCIAFCNFICTYLMFAVINPILNNVNASIAKTRGSDNPTKITYLKRMQWMSFKFTVFRNVILCMGIFNNFVLLSMSGWAYLQSLSSYYVPFMKYTGTTISSLVVLISLKHRKNLFCNFINNNEIPRSNIPNTKLSSTNIGNKRIIH